MDELSQIFASPAATAVFFYSSFVGFLIFGVTVGVLQAAESRHRHPQPIRQRGAAVGHR